MRSCCLGASDGLCASWMEGGAMSAYQPDTEARQHNGEEPPAFQVHLKGWRFLAVVLSGLRGRLVRAHGTPLHPRRAQPVARAEAARSHLRYLRRKSANTVSRASAAGCVSSSRLPGEFAPYDRDLRGTCQRTNGLLPYNPLCSSDAVKA